MDVFLEAFFSIDTHNTEQITANDLKVYMDKNDFEEDFINKWFKIFDKDHDGVITLDEFCDCLGLQPKHARQYIRKQSAALSAKSPTRTLPSDVTILKVSMPLDMQFIVIDLSRESLAWPIGDTPAAITLKQELDNQLGRVWHVVMVIGEFWSFYSHMPEYNINFKIGRNIFIIWRTPADAS